MRLRRCTNRSASTGSEEDDGSAEPIGVTEERATAAQDLLTGDPAGDPMLRSLKELEEYRVAATDGDVGRVVNFLFDDQRWAIRHLVVTTGGFFSERKVLISPISFREVDWATHLFHLALTKDNIRNSPTIDADQPVSRQRENDYYQYYRYPHYWGYMGVWGTGYYPSMLASAQSDARPEHADRDAGDVHLRSVKDVCGYHVQGGDDAVGFIDDFIVDDETWEVRYFVVDTSHWWWGHRVLVAPHWASDISWAQRKMFLNLSREAIKGSPSWDPTSVVRREYEARVHDYYGLRGYWGETTKDAPSHLPTGGQ